MHLLFSIIYGTAITLISGFFLNIEGFIGASRWGYPIHWMWRMITSSEYSPPLEIEWINLIIDIVFWSIIVFILFVIVYRKEFFKK